MKKILGVIETLFIWYPGHKDGFRQLTGYKKYTVVRNKIGDVILITYNNIYYHKLINNYLNENNIDMDALFINEETMSKKQFNLLEEYKLVMLDKKLMLYKNLKVIGERGSIKDYSPNKLKDKFNIFERL